MCFELKTKINREKGFLCYHEADTEVSKFFTIHTYYISHTISEHPYTHSTTSKTVKHSDKPPTIQTPYKPSNVVSL